MKNFGLRFGQFWFGPKGTTGFALMRVAFGLVAFSSFVLQWKEVTRFYSEAGFMSNSVMAEFLRADFRYSVLNFVADPTLVFLIYLLFLIALVLVILGIWTRPAMIVSAILLFSFHERNPYILAGGDTLIRLIAFVLVFAPCDRSYSMKNLRRRLKYWLEKRKNAPPLTMPAWPYRLHLWQIIVMYTASVWTKLLGTMWADGSATAITIHHEHFTRLPIWAADRLEPFWIFMNYFTLVTQSLWPLLLIFPIIHWISPRLKPYFPEYIVRRLAILGGIIVHGGILLTMDVGIFSLAVMTAYIGVLTEEDFDAIKKFFRRFIRGNVTVLFDGHCRLCLRSVFWLMTLDSLGRLHFVDIHDTEKRKKIAPKISFEALDRALHIKLPNGKFLSGFRAFRRIACVLPWLWIFVPFLYIPGADIIGERVYVLVASRRSRCNGPHCRI